MAGGVGGAPPASPRYAITFGEVAIAHVGGASFGAAGGGANAPGGGYSVGELRALAAASPGSRLVMVSDALPAELRAANEAAVLVFPAGSLLEAIGTRAGCPLPADALLAEQRRVRYDRMYWDSRRQATLNKRARYNVVFGEAGMLPSADFRQPTVVGFREVPYLRGFQQWLPAVLGPKAAGLQAEGNHYFEAKSGIGFHGDAERRVVICLSLGGGTTLRYRWRLAGTSDSHGEPVDIRVGHGDVYVMSEKATGHDWRMRSRVRVVHAAGAKKYLQ